MSHWKLRVAAGMAMVTLSGALGGCSYKLPVFCGIIPFDLTAAFIVTVPEREVAKYDQRIASFMSAHGLSVAKGSYPTSEPLGMRTPYMGYQVEGCDGESYIWSSNSTKPSEYLVTFHRNPLFKDETTPLRNGFLLEFRRRYHIRPYVDWRS